MTTVKWSIPYRYCCIFIVIMAISFLNFKGEGKIPILTVVICSYWQLVQPVFFFQVAYLKVFSQQGFKETIFPVFKGLWFHGCIITLKAELICYYYHNKYFFKQETLREKHRNGLLTSLHDSAYNSSSGTLIFTLCFDRAI